MKTPHIGLVAIGGSAWMGGANYVRNLATAALAAEPSVRISWLCGSSLRDEWCDVHPRCEVRQRHRFVSRFLPGTHARIAAIIDQAGIDFLYPLTYDNDYNLGLRFPVASALGASGWAGWVPDFQHRHLPALFSEKAIRWRDAQIALLLAEAPVVVLSSESAAADLRTWFPDAAHKARVLRFTVPPPKLNDGADAPGPDIPERFFLVCNQFWKHKNHLVIFEALRILRDRGIAPVVLCTGKFGDYRDPAYSETLKTALENYGLRDQLRLLGLVPRAQQVALLRRAIAIIQPSLFEGWSTVVEDVRALGRPSLLSDLAVHREQNPDGAHFFPAQSAEALAALIASAWRDWPAGPDRAAETAALAEASRRLADFGRCFLELASANRRRTA